MKLNEILGTEFPIIQGGMANIATGEFAAAVSNAGAMGLIGAGGMDADTFRENIRKCRTLTHKPFGVNIMLMHPQAREMAQIAAEERVPFITTGAGNPASYIPMWKEAGAKVFPVVSVVALAKLVARAGADGVIAEGRQLVAAFALGACGAQVGTCLLVSEECPIHENYKAAVLKAKDSGTVVTGRIGGTPVRILKNPMAKTYIAKEKEGADKLELEEFTLGALRRAVFEGDVKSGSLMAGQVAGMLHAVRPLRAILEELCGGCQGVLERMEKEGF